MKLFLGRAEIRQLKYVSDCDKAFIDRRIIMAEDEEAAMRKYGEFWEDRVDEYGELFHIRSMDVTEAII